MANKVIMEKTYYLSDRRTILIGTLLMLVGLGTLFTGFNIHASFWHNFQNMFLDFSGVFHFLASLLLLLVKLALIIGGYYVLKRPGKIIRAKTDAKGLYYKQMTGGNRYEKNFSDLNPLIFVPYVNIIDIQMVKNVWLGTEIKLKTIHGDEMLTMLNVLNSAEKKELCNTVKRHI